MRKICCLRVKRLGSIDPHSRRYLHYFARTDAPVCGRLLSEHDPVGLNAIHKHSPFANVHSKYGGILKTLVHPRSGVAE
jgi:hypothetical protein